MHGILPSSVKLHGPSLKAYPRLTFQLSIQGRSAVNYRIIEEESFCIVGITRRVPIQFNGVNPEIASMWKSLTCDDIDQLKKLSNVEPQGLIQASVNFSEGRMEEKGELDHYVGVATTKECPGNLTKLDVMQQHGLYSKPLDHFPIHCKMSGDASVLNGSLPLIMSWQEARRFYGMRVRIYLHPPSEVRFGYRFWKNNKR
ncbi:hypothetical protein PAECIP111894_04510 [Paenibacillus pseudetheri]|uniref:Uncharacterized protein n=1 Tax=Paenibacillus pseudetheri TaxID=2897682 RepID=A0ABM9BHK2_9BACL|nr:hypothetical protein PAECIP111894_04510 [Paenibacillus pseudetheri]